ncbi:uncharacterized protein LOC113780137 [Coffea eugenioides]|uniref:uncharacterized protein LOC113780137 n=1 Tax=Coffea eugenioides TaxID=49369 RepID=UPI000F6127F9|nr:uncharacterized protein LOC113780137 [Coffea eugenioides]
MFTVPCNIGNIRIEKAMLDLGASINVMSRSIYNMLNLGPLKETDIIIQLLDRSNAYPDGILEDILVQVDKLVFPADFYVLDMEEDHSANSPPILLGRPFFRTSRTKIDVYSGTLTMEFDGDIIRFNIYDAMKYPNESHSVFVVDVIDSLMHHTFELTDDDALKVALTRGLDREYIQEMRGKFDLSLNFQETIFKLNFLKPVRYEVPYVELPQSHLKLLPSIVHAPKLDLKQLSSHLKYVFLGEGDIFPVIISYKLTAPEEEKLIRVLKDHKEAIGWILADIKGLSPAICMHIILLQEDAKPSREAQRRLNPPMMEVVKKEVLKLLDAGFYRCFIKDFSRISHPLCQLLQKDADFNFDEACKVSFDALKESLTSAPVVQPPNWSLPFEIMCDATLKYLLTKKEAKPRLLRWILLVQEFDLEIRDKKDVENLVADHLSRFVISQTPTSLQDNFPDEHLLAIHKQTPWYADIVNYLVTKTLPKDLSKAQKDKIKSDAKYYVGDEPYL